MKRSKAAAKSKSCAADVGEVRLHPRLTNYVGYCLHKVALRLRAKVDEKIAPSGLVAPQFGMMVILKVEGSLTQIELGSYMAMDKATVVRMIDGLEARGYLRRVPSPTDRRANKLELTDAGLKTLDTLEKLRSEAEREFLTPLNAEERSSLRQIITKLALG